MMIFMKNSGSRNSSKFLNDLLSQSRREEEVGKMSRASASVGNEIFGDLNAAAAAAAAGRES